MRFVLKTVIVVGVTALVLLVAGFVVLRAVNLDHYKALIAHTVQSATGRELVITGDIQVRPSLIPAIVVEGIEFRNPGFATQPNMFTLGRLEGELELLPLLRGRLVIGRVRLIDPVLVLELARGGMRNWRFEKRGVGRGSGLHIQQASIRDGRITYLNSDTGNRVDFFIHEAHAQLKSGSDIIEAVASGGWKFRDWQDVSIDAKGTLGSLASYFSDAPTEVDVTGRTDDVAWHVTGSVGDVLRASRVDLRLNGSTDSFANVSSFTPFPLPDLGPTTVTARLTGDLPHYGVRDIQARLRSDAYRADLSGSVDALVFSNRVDLSLDATATSAIQTLAAFGVEWPLDGAVGVDLQLTGDNEAGYGLPALDIAMHTDDLRAEFRGSLARLFPD